MRLVPIQCESPNKTKKKKRMRSTWTFTSGKPYFSHAEWLCCCAVWVVGLTVALTRTEIVVLEEPLCKPTSPPRPRDGASRCSASAWFRNFLASFFLSWKGVQVFFFLFTPNFRLLVHGASLGFEVKLISVFFLLRGSDCPAAIRTAAGRLQSRLQSVGTLEAAEPLNGWVQAVCCNTTIGFHPQIKSCCCCCCSLRN